MKRFCVIGSGPSGLYCAKYLLKQYGSHFKTTIDIIEKLPTPYGLIRYGVAPDHADVKTVEADFEDVLRQPEVRYFGNVHIGKVLNLKDLIQHYHAIILCYGANADRQLNLPIIDEKKTKVTSSKESDFNIFSAREFVYWYNGHPYFRNISPDLKSSADAIVIGHGNVAIDCARILTKSVDELATTDITEEALESLRQSKINSVKMIGRRGPVQSAFTIKEFRELGRLTDVEFKINKEQFEKGLNNFSMDIIEKSRPKKRIFELMKSNFETELRASKKQLEVEFLRNPKEIIVENGRVKSVSFTPQKMIEGTESIEVDSSMPEEMKSCGLLIKSVGFVGETIGGDLGGILPFDEKKGFIQHSGIGKVNSASNLFTAGWIKRGATGIVATNVVCAKQTVHAASEFLAQNDPQIEDFDLKELLQKRNVNFVDFEGWKKIDHIEKYRGKEKGKPREKITSIEEMLEIGSS